MSKSAILTMTRSLAIEWARFGIRLNAGRQLLRAASLDAGTMGRGARSHRSPEQERQPAAATRAKRVVTAPVSVSKAARCRRS
jgi:NAD(P)-dependent dehydrogenase (short-subunit alcohol dehydrogenase family)